MQGAGSVGTRVACIPIHRLCRDTSTLSPKRSAAAAECSPPTKHAVHSCQSAESTDACSPCCDTESQCQKSADAYSGFQLNTRVVKQLPQEAGESKDIDVKVKTPEKSCEIVKVKKTNSPIATDMCSVSLSRIVIPENSDITGAVKRVPAVSPSKDATVGAQSVIGNVQSSASKKLRMSACNKRSDTTVCIGEIGTDPASIVYPSCEKNIFLGGFGLTNKAELPVLRHAAGNRLHRDVGGKLRRSIKPNVVTEMVYQRTNTARSTSFEDESGVYSSSGSLHTSRESSPQSSHARHVSAAFVKKLSSTLSKRLKPPNAARIQDSDLSAEVCKTETSSDGAGDTTVPQQSSLSILADMALAHLDATRPQAIKHTTPAQDALTSSAMKPKVKSGVFVIFYRFVTE